MAKQLRAEQTRTTIIEAAAQMFDRQGFGSTSLSDIVARGGITKGALYFHFASKEALARAVIARQHQLSVNAAERLLARGLPGLETVLRTPFLLAEQVLTDPVARAGVRLTLEGEPCGIRSTDRTRNGPASSRSSCDGACGSWTCARPSTRTPARASCSAPSSVCRRWPRCWSRPATSPRGSRRCGRC